VPGASASALPAALDDDDSQPGRDAAWEPPDVDEAGPDCNPVSARDVSSGGEDISASYLACRLASTTGLTAARGALCWRHA
jgi:hypothetical protein